MPTRKHAAHPPAGRPPRRSPTPRGGGHPSTPFGDELPLTATGEISRETYLRARIRDIPDFPQEGILFRDITPLLADPTGFHMVIDAMAERFIGEHIDAIVGIESRGFIFGAALACRLGVGFVPARKPGKLPAETLREEYSLEYGTDALEIHKDAIAPGEKVLVIDDLLATGGTLAATCRLVEALGGRIVEVVTVIELIGLHGRDKIKGYPYHAMIGLEVNE